MRWIIALPILFSCLCSNFAASNSKVPAPPNFPGASVGISVIDLSSGLEVTGVNQDKLFTPASVLKLLTTATALERLSPEYRFSTSFFYSGEIKNGILYGNLIIRGGGDGTLGSVYFDSTQPDQTLLYFAEQLKKNGIHTINGKLIVDQTLFPEPRYPAGRLWEDMANYYGAAPSGLSWRDNTFHLTLSSPPRSGENCQIVSVSPPLDDINFISHVYSATHNRDSAYIFGYPGLSQWEVRGSIPTNRPEFTIRGALPNPGETFAHELAKHIDYDTDNNIIDIQDDINYEDLHLLFTHLSPPLEEIIQIVNQRSHNLLADHLFLLNGLNAPKHHSLWDVATWNTIKYWKNAGIDMPLRFHDGSGLSPKNLASPRFFTDLLRHVNQTQYQSVFQKSLSVSGQSGSLRRMWSTNNRRGRVLAKSGSMQGVLGYSGYIYTNSGRKLAFCIIVNNYTQPFLEIRNSIEEYINFFIDHY
ncbi:D-alanyl-D-alanine carboxypeptidase/D-alanyl-D-alanine endopeptidase [Natronoflexus pectinivorans]|uniref:D-alanyl-D-alanine carboxypeptidase/D-alanyl-D-alanine-endopeptidase (Penicillin-binding protein 4) n=1 Tax=Natronoflexus pectinivorans TaxID=682526 RepID=A0A4R2GKS4_9BACT|nr:D-alanyl-D-alanine carboxypeptidase/D-alanyl-D-alanine-endopeptidase [Natronoflexus pectinivorans]TCO09289.1 D-alanyl-D-alanine carboxypeptidase/D-alanyl-D-alanine-endopeptidase (penicillin-binding protein 4) [Natronoflexus pectinivorans]